MNLKQPTQKDYDVFSKDKKLQLYFPKAFNRRKRQSVDINKKLLARDSLDYNSHTGAITIKKSRNSVPGGLRTVQPPQQYLDSQGSSFTVTGTTPATRQVTNMTPVHDATIITADGASEMQDATF